MSETLQEGTMRRRRPIDEEMSQTSMERRRLGRLGQMMIKSGREQKWCIDKEMARTVASEKGCRVPHEFFAAREL